MSTIPQPNKNLESWVSRLARDLTPDGGITRIELWHAIEGEGGERLLTIDMNDRPEDEDPADMTLEIWTAAYEDSCTRSEGTTQRYVVKAFRGSDTICEESKNFLIQGTAVTSLIGSGSEPPTPRGLLSQEMRHSGDLHAMVIRMSEAVAGQTAQMLQGERRENQDLRRQLSRVFELEQELLDRQEERQMRREEREESRERMNKLFELGSSLLPMLVTKFLEKPATPPPPPPPQQPPPSATPPPAPPRSPSGSASAPPAGGGVGEPPPLAAAPSGDDDGPLQFARGAARDKSVGALLASLSSEQIETISGALSMEQALALMEIYASHRDDAEKAESSRATPQPKAADRDSCAVN